MKNILKHFIVLIAVILFTGFAAIAQTKAVAASTDTTMKTYVIERDIPGAGQFSPEKLKEISQASCTVLKEMGPAILWDHSYVTGDKIFCVYKAQNEELIKEHGAKGGFPVTAIYQVDNVISPATATAAIK
ncbi:MAG TPA: DUF4242 domain-containing protein [Ferruginibacter sp.]|nr:DUF4242 domain-containing protein [Ferruginibacter sp.]